MIRVDPTLENFLIDFRHTLHKYPELSYQEYKTTQKIKDYFASLNVYPVDFSLKTGAVFDIVGNQPGPTIALRADIDALPMSEDNTCSYRSQSPEVMHACGHDMHTTALIGAGTLLLKNKEKKHINLERGIFDPIIPIPSPITGEIEDTTGLGTIKAMKRITKQTTSKEYSQPIFLEKNKTKYIKIKNPLNDHIYTNYIESTSIENVINKIEFIQLHLNQREGIITDSILSAHKSYKPFVGKVYSNTVKLIK